jgi:hypothetical protein
LILHLLFAAKLVEHEFAETAKSPVVVGSRWASRVAERGQMVRCKTDTSSEAHGIVARTQE